TQNEFISLGFKEYKKLFDLTQLNIQKTSDSLFMNNIRMKTLRQLDKDIDSLKKIPDSLIKRNQADLKLYIQFAKYKDSTITKKQKAIAEKKIDKKKSKSFDALIPDSLKSSVREQATNSVNNIRSVLQVTGNDYTTRLSDITYHEIEWQKKLSLSFACLVLFFIGAPLGSIIRKGGLGLPLVVALIFFLVFYLLNIFGEKFTKDNVLDPITGMWLPVIVLTPIGFFLTYKAMHDSQLFNKEYYYRLFKKIRTGTQSLFTGSLKN
ncbi:MAG: LptF/LptG family permease, partial [Bacteroidota bacterium]|nr:LptF/LptG family permease [Bacteroidota bacterium]